MSCELPREVATDDAREEEQEHEEERVFENWMQRGSHLRLLRALEQQDELERLQQQHENDKVSTTPPETTAGGCEKILDYATYLEHQRYHDDLKHVDYRYIDFGRISGGDDDSSSSLIVEQDKTLGKGGFCWDAAHILGEYLASQPSLLLRDWTMIELGCGTALWMIHATGFLPELSRRWFGIREGGMMIAKACPNVHVTLSDLPPLMPLIERNLARNFVSSAGQVVVKAQILEWSEDDSCNTRTCGTFDLIVGADVVASIYNAIALARTIHRLAHAHSIVYVSFKERLSSVHRQFEQELAGLFQSIEFVNPTTTRNRNPQVQILVARNKMLWPSIHASSCRQYNMQKR